MSAKCFREAVLLRKHDPHLTRALAPTIEEAITASVQNNPHPLADALFPVIGPAIRKAIAASLSAMLESLNRTVEHSFRGVRSDGVITALTTGRSVRRNGSAQHTRSTASSRSC